MNKYIVILLLGVVTVIIADESPLKRDKDTLIKALKEKFRQYKKQKLSGTKAADNVNAPPEVPATQNQNQKQHEKAASAIGLALLDVSKPAKVKEEKKPDETEDNDDDEMNAEDADDIDVELSSKKEAKKQGKVKETEDSNPSPANNAKNQAAVDLKNVADAPKEKVEDISKKPEIKNDKQDAQVQKPSHDKKADIKQDDKKESNDGNKTEDKDEEIKEDGKVKEDEDEKVKEDKDEDIKQDEDKDEEMQEDKDSKTEKENDREDDEKNGEESDSNKGNSKNSRKKLKDTAKQIKESVKSLKDKDLQTVNVGQLKKLLATSVENLDKAGRAIQNLLHYDQAKKLHNRNKQVTPGPAQGYPQQGYGGYPQPSTQYQTTCPGQCSSQCAPACRDPCCRFPPNFNPGYNTAPPVQARGSYQQGLINAYPPHTQLGGSQFNQNYQPQGQQCGQQCSPQSCAPSCSASCCAQSPQVPQGVVPPGQRSAGCPMSCLRDCAAACHARCCVPGKKK